MPTTLAWLYDTTASSNSARQQSSHSVIPRHCSYWFTRSSKFCRSLHTSSVFGSSFKMPQQSIAGFILKVWSSHPFVTLYVSQEVVVVFTLFVALNESRIHYVEEISWRSSAMQFSLLKLKCSSLRLCLDSTHRANSHLPFLVQLLLVRHKVTRLYKVMFNGDPSVYSFLAGNYVIAWINRGRA